MKEALQFLHDYETWIYLFLGLAGAWYGRRFLVAWHALRQAVFGIEREAARARLQQAALMLTLLFLLALAEFTAVSFVFPVAAQEFPLPDTAAQQTALVQPMSTTLPPTATPLPTVAADASGCVAGQVAFSAPEEGAQVSGTVEIKGTADAPNFGFYKYEMARPGAALWLTIGAGRQPVRDGLLGLWDTTTLPPGEYVLRLVVTDTDGNALPPCMRSVYVVAPPP